MRIWHESLIPLLCRQHLLAMWREGLGCYKIIVEGKKGYRNHPAVKEFINDSMKLALVLGDVREEMLRRGYHPKPINLFVNKILTTSGHYKPWQSLDQQIALLKQKGCRCQI